MASEILFGLTFYLVIFTVAYFSGAGCLRLFCNLNETVRTLTTTVVIMLSIPVSAYTFMAIFGPWGVLNN
jgi:hypothetical protein